MRQFIQNIILAAQTADQRKGLTIYDLIGVVCAVVFFLSIIVIGGTLEHVYNF